MDLITHAVMGAASTQLVLGKKTNKALIIAGVLAALAPDLDVFIGFFSHQPLNEALWHRGFTHSLAFIPFGAALVALILCILPLFRKQWSLTFIAALLGYATHALLDACTSYGTQLFWPWSNQRISWDILSIVDPLFTIVLGLGTAWSIVFKEQLIVSSSLFCAGFYLLFQIHQHQKTLEFANHFALAHHLSITRLRAMPALGSSTSWKVIANADSCLFLADMYTPLWKNTKISNIKKLQGITKKDFISLSAAQKKQLQLFAWFTDYYLIVANKKPLTIGDGRYTVYDGKNLFTLWGVKVNTNENYLLRERMIPILLSCSTS